jgi:hypothetical protein
MSSETCRWALTEAMGVELSGSVVAVMAIQHCDNIAEPAWRLHQIFAEGDLSLPLLKMA